MDASVEAYHGDDGPQRPMTIPELCGRKGPFAGVMKAVVYRRKHLHDYQGSVWAGVLLPLLFLVPFIQTHTRLVGLGFAAVALGNLAVQEVRVISNNVRVWRALHALRDNPLAVNLTDDRGIHRMINSEGVPGTFHQFVSTPKRGGEGRDREAYSVINRSDGMGTQIVFLEFEDNHDRVMFLLQA